MDYEKLLDSLEKIARAAGEETLKYFRGDAAVSFKQDGSPVTEADLRAEELIVARLRELYPDIPAVGEESGGSAVGKSCWLIDPLDGTREFVAGRDEYTVNIALVEEGVPKAGAVYAPAQELMYIGCAAASFRVSGGKKERLPKNEQKALVIAASRSHGSYAERKLYEALEEKAGRENLLTRKLNIGSSLKFCMIAEGEASVYLRTGPTMFWDTAAAHAVLKGAGGEVYELKNTAGVWKIGYPLSYDGAALKNPPFIALLPLWEEFAKMSLALSAQ